MDAKLLSNVMYCTSFPSPRIEVDICHLCLEAKADSYEHVPPESAYNGENRLWYRLNRDCSQQYRKVRNGFRVKTLCEKCNSGVCAPYAAAYVSFVKHLVNSPRFFADCSSGARLVRVPSDTLFIAKEIAAMILAIEPSASSRKFAVLRRFVRDPIATIDPPFRILAFLVPDEPTAGTITRYHARVDTFAPGYGFVGGEISLFPFGFVYCTEIGKGYVLDRFTDISHWFSNGHVGDRYNELVKLHLRATGGESIQVGVTAQVRNGPQCDY